MAACANVHCSPSIVQEEVNDGELDQRISAKFTLVVSNRFSPLMDLSLSPCLKTSRPSTSVRKVLEKMREDDARTPRSPKNYVASLRRLQDLYDSTATLFYACILHLKETKTRSRDFVRVKCRCLRQIEVLIEGRGPKTFPLRKGWIHVKMSGAEVEEEEMDLNVVMKITIAYRKKKRKKTPRIKTTEVTQHDTDEEESLELPMTDEFECQNACSRCAAVINKRYNCSVHPDVHQDGVPCDKNVLLARKKTEGSDWCLIRVEPLKNPRLKSAKAPRLCKAVQEAANTCDRGVNCSFAHSEVELKLWKTHINSQVSFSILKLWRRLCRDSRPKDVTEEIKRLWCGSEENDQFFFACPQCLTDGRVKQSCGDHGLPLRLMFGCPNDPPDADAMPVVIREPGAPNPELIEEDVWQFVDGEGVHRKALLGPVKKKTEEDTPQIPDGVPCIPFPYKLDQVCKPCLRSDRISYRDGLLCNSSIKRHPWVRPAYWSEDRKVEVGIPPSNFSLRLCSYGKCRDKEICRHPHNEIEREVWTWLKNHKVTLDAAWESFHDGGITGEKEED